MFNDDSVVVKARITEVLKDYELEDILDENDISVEEALYYLFIGGWIALPETQPITIELEHGDTE